MKVNLKKIGAIVAGATILASSAAFAGLMFESTTLVDDNGAPVAKVVIGSGAHPSDGVAAGLIAGKLVSEAYKTETLTAQVAGLDTVVCTAGGEGTGTCSITDEKARLEITVPGAAVAGTWTGENLIGDHLNRELLDREWNDDTVPIDSIDSDQGYSIGGSDTSESANPFTDGAGGDLGVNPVFLYKVDGGQFTPFQDQTLMDDDSGNTYVEMQALWLEGDNHFDSDPDDVVGRLEFLAYTLKFDGPGGDEMGIPVCTDAENSDYAWCKSKEEGSNIDDATETHRLKVYFLGEEWIISEMEEPNCDPDPSTATDGPWVDDDGTPGPSPGDTGINEDSPVSNEYTLCSGGMVKLAKESVSGILNQGESLPVDDLKFQLDDLEAHGETVSAILSVLDANGNVLKKDKVDPGETKEFNVAGKTYRFHVYKVAPGYTFGAKWADVAIFAEELELEDGQELDADEDSNPDYQVALGWKNMDATIGIKDRGNPEEADTLRTVIIYSDSIDDLSSGGEENLEVGDYVPIVQDPVAWKLSYKGLDITGDDRFSLEFEIKRDDKKISESKGPLYNPGNTQSECTIYAPYVEVTSGDSGSVFRVDRTDSGGELADDEFFVAVADAYVFGSEIGAQCDGDNNPANGYEVDIESASVFMKLSPASDSYGVAEHSTPIEVEYEAIGDGSNAFAPPEGGAILIEWRVDVESQILIGALLDSEDPGGGREDCAVISPECSDVYFAVAEKAGTGGSNDFVDYFIFGIADPLTADPSAATFDFDSTSFAGPLLTSDSEEILYGHAVSDDTCWYDDTCVGFVPSGPVDRGVEMVEEDYISERGSVFKSIDKDAVEFDMAHKLARAQWFLASEETEGAEGATIVTLGEGESTTVSGVTVKVLEITETVGPCTAAGGGAACVADTSGVSAVILPDSVATVDAAVPANFESYGNLIILDEDAVGVNTLISVGGDRVNSVTAGLLQGSPVDWSTETTVVKTVEGSKIVVAGREADDTLAAAEDFVSQLRKE